MKKPKIAIIGAGPAGFFAAWLLSQFEVDVDIYEKGNDNNGRQRCPYVNSGVCARCPYCNISTGSGGGGGGADGKVLESEGGILVDILGKKLYHLYLQWANSILLYYSQMAGISPIRYGRETTEYLKECKSRAKRCGLKMEIHPIDHYGTDGMRQLNYQIENDLLSKSNIKIFFNTEVTNVDFKGRIVYSKKNGAVEYDSIIIAPGRSGSDWFAKVCADNNIQSKFGKLIIGVRAEVPDYINGERIGPLVKIQKQYLEAKLRYILPDGHPVKACKTFCECDGGSITTEYYPSKGVAVNGHSNTESKTQFSNLSLLLDMDPEEVENPKEFIWNLLKQANDQANGQPITQTYSAFKERRANTAEELKAVKSTKKQLFKGDLTKVFTPAMVSALIAFIERINTVFPGFKDDLILHGVEVKPVSFTPKTDESFQIAPDVYVAGDGVNNTHGYLPALGNGLYAAVEVLYKYRYIPDIGIAYDMLKKDHPFLP